MQLGPCCAHCGPLSCTVVGTESCCLASLIEGVLKVHVQVALILPKVISRALTGVGVGVH